jgi:phosphoesterase RecJ-like protein
VSDELQIAREEREPAVQEIRSGERFLLVTHERPDGDALGSLLAMHHVLLALGKDSVMFIDPADLPLPYEYRFFDLTGLVGEIPGDLEQRIVIFLDCGNIDRNAASVLREAQPLLNIDHHHDNTRFGTTNLVVADASCTAQIVWELMHDLGVSLTSTIADALYVGLITDTGCFAYENTTPRAHQMAAELVASGVQVATIHRRIYEDVPYEKLELLARALARVERYDNGRLTITHLTAQDFDETGAEDSHTEGIIDRLRAVSGTQVAAVAREVTAPEARGTHKVSLRATGDDVDVSAIARIWGGGGHRRAAGFTTDASYPQLVEKLRDLI